MRQSTPYRSILVEAHEGKRLAVLLAPHLRRLLFDLDRMVGAGNKVRRGISVLKPDAIKALQEPVQAAGEAFETAALQEIFRMTRGYPYFLPEWGYQAWNHAVSSPVTLAVVQKTSATVSQRLDENFRRVRFDRLTPREKKFLRAMAELGPGPLRTGDIAEKLEAKINTLGPVRASLIKKGRVYSPSHGDMAFTVPLFDEFMRRAMPQFER